MSAVLPKTWNMPESIRVRLGEQAGHQRMMLEEGHLLLILHALPKTGKPEREPVLFWRDPEGSWKASGGGAGAAELKAHIDGFAREIDRLELRMQQPPNAEVYFEVLHHAGPLLRTVRNLHKTLQQAREELPEDRNILVARDRAGEAERAVELLHADAKNGMEYMVAKRAEEQAKSSQELIAAGHRLNLLIAIFLPLTALGSAFGMNMRHGLEHIDSPVLFWGMLATGLVLGFVVKALLTVGGKPGSPGAKAQAGVTAS